MNSPSSINFRLLHPDSGVLAAYLDRKEQRRFRCLHRLWFPLLVIAPLALGVLALMGYLYTARTLVELLVDTTWMAVGLVLLAALAQRWLRVTRQRIAYEAAMERRQAELESKQEPDTTDSQKAPRIPDSEEHGQLHQRPDRPVRAPDPDRRRGHSG